MFLPQNIDDFETKEHRGDKRLMTSVLPILYSGRSIKGGKVRPRSCLGRLATANVHLEVGGKEGAHRGARAREGVSLRGARAGVRTA